jgi:hypothetical protein
MSTTETCIRSFNLAGITLKSSRRLTNATIIPPHSNTTIPLSRSILARREAEKATIIATPPSKGVALSWIFLPSGLSSTLNFVAINLIKGVNRYERESEKRKT